MSGINESLHHAECSSDTDSFKSDSSLEEETNDISDLKHDHDHDHDHNHDHGHSHDFQ
jgi:hypothetical protein